MPTPRLTLVTLLFDLARREPATGRRTAKRYLELADEFVLGIDCELVAFVDPELAEPIEASRHARGLGARTRVIPIAFEDLPIYALLPKISNARAMHPLLNGDPDKDTPLYTALICAKPALAACIAKEDPFSGSHVGWIDIGVRHGPYRGEDPFAHPTDRVRLLSMRPLFEREIAERGPYLSALRGHIAGRYACGTRSNMAWLGAAFAQLMKETLEAGYAGSEEQLLPLLVAAQPERFEFHHGDYDDTLPNYFKPHDGAENLAFQLRVWREEGVPGEGAALARAIYDSVARNEFNARPESLATLLDDCFIAAWYGEPHPHPVARRIADLYLDRAERDPAFRDVFLRNEIHVRRNFSFCKS